jgi:hypothetical protein
MKPAERIAQTTTTRRGFIYRVTAATLGLAAVLSGAGSGKALAAPSFQEATTPRYEGRLVEAHIHLAEPVAPPDASGARLFDLLDRDGYAWALAFYPGGADGSAVPKSARIATEAQSRVVPLVAPGVASRDTFMGGYVSDGNYESAMRALLRPEGAFAGIGEIPLYFPWLNAITFQSEQMAAIFAAVDAAHGIVMVHPRTQRDGNATTRDEVEGALSRFPNATMLLHGNVEIFDTVEPLFATYPNLYFSFDFPTWSGGPGGIIWGGSVEQGGSVDQFNFSLDRAGGIDALVRRGTLLIGPRVAKHPDRTMIGTDRFLAWHFDAGVGRTVAEITRRILGQMRPGDQEALAYQTADRVFGPHLIV